MSEQTVSLSRSTPEAQGISTDAILTFIDAAERELESLHSFILLRHGNVVAEGWWAPYASDRPHMLFSLSKSFCSTAAGMAAAEGHFSLDDKVISFFPEDTPDDVSENLAAMRVRDLLAMATGHVEDTTGYLHRDQNGNWVRAFLARPVDKTPGTHFVYNSGATYMVSAIVQKRTGQRLLDYLTPRLFEPLGIVGATWEQSPQGVDVGGWGLKITTEDIARFGQLYLQDGVWNGKRLLPEGWVAEASAKHVSNGDDPNNDWNQGYGFQFWRCRHNAYRGDGAFGQYCVLMPDQDAVIAITSGLGNMQAPLNLIWQHLLPAMGDAALPEDRVKVGLLKERTAGMVMKAPEGKTTAPVASGISGVTYRVEANDLPIEAIRYTFTDGGATVTVRKSGQEENIACGQDGKWVIGETTFSTRDGQHHPIAATGAWVSDDTYLTSIAYIETPFVLTVRCRFDGDRIELETKNNVGFGPNEPTRIKGARE